MREILLGRWMYLSRVTDDAHQKFLQMQCPYHQECKTLLKIVQIPQLKYGGRRISRKDS